MEMVRHHAVGKHPATREILIHPHEHPERFPLLIAKHKSPIAISTYCLYLVIICDSIPQIFLQNIECWQGHQENLQGHERINPKSA